MNPGRFHLLLTADGGEIMHGWWGNESTARRKFSSWIGEYGTIPSACLVLADEDEARQVAVWPDEE
ncbi:hypothetical protein ABT124_50960 [Streptomyces sp. NPDC001982]|uniref:hypothetical protein n=1 Tax=Streptomyces sp. NPDC001982 TaxID=3154405 RepID=UPI00332AA48A